jgi:hypothetical protein
MEQAEKRHGGYRPKAGRKSKYGVKTRVISSWLVGGIGRSANRQIGNY